MVKGNSDRRKQLVRLRKLDKSTENNRRLSQNPLKATITEIRARILSDNLETICFINSHEITKSLCNSYLRRGECDNRKCRFDHSTTLSSTNIKSFDSVDSLNGLVKAELSKLESS